MYVYRSVFMCICGRGCCCFLVTFLNYYLICHATVLSLSLSLLIVTVICYSTSGQFEMLSLGIILSTRIALEHQCTNIMYYTGTSNDRRLPCHSCRKASSFSLYCSLARSLSLSPLARLSLLINLRNILMTTPVFLSSMLTSIGTISVRYDV